MELFDAIRSICLRLDIEAFAAHPVGAAHNLPPWHPVDHDDHHFHRQVLHGISISAWQGLDHAGLDAGLSRVDGGHFECQVGRLFRSRLCLNLFDSGQGRDRCDCDGHPTHDGSHQGTRGTARCRL
jgi:hypothetical protein